MRPRRVFVNQRREDWSYLVQVLIEELPQFIENCSRLFRCIRDRSERLREVCRAYFALDGRERPVLLSLSRRGAGTGERDR